MPLSNLYGRLLLGVFSNTLAFNTKYKYDHHTTLKETITPKDISKMHRVKMNAGKSVLK